MKKQWIFGALLLLVLAALVVVQFSKDKEVKESEQEVIKIGAILPLTGELSIYGQKCKKGMDLALDEINSNEAFLKKIIILYEDSRGNASDAVSSTQKLISINKVNAIIGEVSSSNTSAMIPVVEKAKVLLFSTASSSPKLSGVSEYFVRNWSSDITEASQLAEFAHDSLRINTVGIIYVNNDYGIGLKEEFDNKFSQKGGSITQAESYSIGTSDFKTIIQKIKQSKADAYYLAGYKELGLIVKQIRESNVNSQIIACTNFGDSEVLSLSGQYAEGVIFGTPVYEPEKQEDSHIKNFYNAYFKKHNAPPSLFEANSYDAVMIIHSAISEHGNTLGIEISNYIRGLKNYEGAGGKVSFNSDGDVQRQIGFKVVTQNKFINYSDFKKQQ